MVSYPAPPTHLVPTLLFYLVDTQITVGIKKKKTRKVVLNMVAVHMYYESTNSN